MSYCANVVGGMGNPAATMDGSVLARTKPCGRASGGCELLPLLLL